MPLRRIGVFAEAHSTSEARQDIVEGVLTIGLTGGIATGKSSVARMLAQRGAVVLDVDRVAHETYAVGTPGYEAVVGAFGPQIVSVDGAIDRRALGRIVFGDPNELRRLTDIVWPLTLELVRARRDAAEADGASVYVVDAAVLREAGWDALTDEVWLVRTSRELARERLLARSNLTEAEADARLDAQAAASLGELGIDRIIENDGSMDELEIAIEAAWRAALEAAR